MAADMAIGDAMNYKHAGQKNCGKLELPGIIDARAQQRNAKQPAEKSPQQS